jgi:large subunit ribosomal protein L29
MTKQTDSLVELRRLTVAELDDYLSKQRRRLFEVRFQQATGQVENHRQVREIRHEIARAMTVKIEIERGLRPELVLAATAPAATPAKAAKPKPKPKAKPAHPAPPGSRGRSCGGTGRGGSRAR